MATSMELNIARKKLVDALGEDTKVRYFATMKLWFRRKMSKEEFDSESRKCLPSESVHLHNEFLLAILNKCQNWPSTHAGKETTGSSHSTAKDRLKKGKVRKKSRPIRATFEHRFQPVNPLLCAPPVMARKDFAQTSSSGAGENGSSSSGNASRLTFCVRETTLPDASMVHGRMFVTAWDSGLDAVDDGAVHLVLAAVENHLKTIMMAVFMRRHAYKLREDRFVHSMGATLPNPYLISNTRTWGTSSDSHQTDQSTNEDPTFKPTSGSAETEVMYEFACGKPTTPVLGPVSLYDLHEALQVRKKAIPSNSVYAVNMERLSARLWHPSHEELDQERLHREERRILAAT